jgi:hypothetical protein
MAVGLPLKTTYADGDVYSASDVNDTNGTINTTAAPFAAGKNKMINGDFFVNQRNFSSSTTSGVYIVDRFKGVHDAGSGTVTYSVQQFTPGTAPVTGYEAKQFGRIVTTGQTLAGTYTILTQIIEDVRTLANQSATFSFWAKAASGTPKVAVEIEQFFGTGGSPSAGVRTYLGQVTLSTSWARYTVSGTVPSISGKTIGTTANTSHLTVNLWTSAGSTYNANTGSIGIQSNTFDFWGVQVENGSTATAFQTATGSIQGELAACQRYYYRRYATTGAYAWYSNFGPGQTTTTLSVAIPLPITMRVTPSTLDYSSSLRVDNGYSASANVSSIVLDSTVASIQQGQVSITTATSITVGAMYTLQSSNSTSTYIGLSAEL